MRKSELGQQSNISYQQMDPEVSSDRLVSETRHEEICLDQKFGQPRPASQLSVHSRFETFIGEQEVDGIGEPLTFEDLKKHHHDNSLKNLQTQTAKEYIDMVKQKIPTNQIYQVIASCYYNENGPFCPVILKVVDKYIQQNVCKYLIQVWDREGRLVFERKLDKPVTNWGMTKEKLMWQEEAGSNVVYMLKIFSKRRPQLYKIVLNGHSQPEGTYTTLDEQDNIVVPLDENQELLINKMIENEKNYTKSNLSQNNTEIIASGKGQDDNIENLLLATKQKLATKVNKIFQEHVAVKNESQLSEAVSRTTIVRAPDKQVDYVYGFLAIATLNKIYYVYIDDFIDNEPDTENLIIEKVYNEGEYDVLDIDPKFKIITFQSLSDAVLCLTVENLETRRVGFLQLSRSRDVTKENKLTITQLGIYQQDPATDPSPLRKYRYMVKNRDNEGSKAYHVCICLRANGRVEIYFNFVMVHQIYAPNFPCVDIETTQKHFYLKIVDKNEAYSGNTDFKSSYRYLKIPHFWRNKIDITTAKPFNDNKKWDRILHYRIANHCKLYTMFSNFSTYTLVAHRNILSVYDMRNKTWLKPKVFEKFIRTFIIREQAQIKLKKKSNEIKQQTYGQSHIVSSIDIFNRYKIDVLSGVNTLEILSLHPDGRLSGKKEPFELFQDQRILRFESGNSPTDGFTFLTDSGKIGAYYRSQNDDGTVTKDFSGKTSFFNFPLAQQNEVTYHIFHSLDGQMYEFLNSNEAQKDLKNILSHDVQFSVTRFAGDSYIDPKKAAKRIAAADEVIREKIKQKKNNKEEITMRIDMKNRLTQLDPVEDFDAIVKLRGFVDVLYLHVPSKDKALMIPISQTLDSNYCINNCNLIKELTKSLDLDPNSSGTKTNCKLLNAFSVYRADFGDNINSFAVAEKDSFTLYNDSKEKIYSYKNLKLGQCYNVHQSYLYAIQDRNFDSIQLTNFNKKVGNDEYKTKMFENSQKQSGFYIYDLNRLFKGKLEVYKIAHTIGGVNIVIDDSKFSDRFSILQDYNNIVSLPFPHLNIMNFVGMGMKHEYLAWREKNGFFHALERKGFLRTWSCASGSQLYHEDFRGLLNGNQFDPQAQNQLKINWLSEFSVYRGDKKDYTYTSGYYQLQDRSISLLASNKSIGKLLKIPETELSVDLYQFIEQNGLVQLYDENRRENQYGNIIFDSEIHGTLNKQIFKSQNPNLNIQILDSSGQADLFIFKVIEIESFEDNKEANKVNVSFSFTHELYRNETSKFKVNENQPDWEISDSPFQRLHLSRDTYKLLEIIDNQLCIIYKRRVEPNIGQFIAWDYDNQIVIQNVSKILLEMTSYPFMFSPNFNFMLDFHFKQKLFVIKEVETGQVLCKLPRDMYSLDIEGMEIRQSLKLVASKICFVDEDLIRVINRQNIECFMQIVDNEDENTVKTYPKSLKLVSSAIIHNLFTNQKNLDNPHQISDQKQLATEDTLDRLIRQNQNYNSQIAILKAFQNTGIDMLNELNRIDYSQTWGSRYANFDCNLTFSMLDWIIVDKILNDDSFHAGDIDEEQQMQIVMNIFPHCRSFLHKLALGKAKIKSKNEDELGDTTQTIQSVRKLFETARKLGNYGILGLDATSKGVVIEIPLTQDRKGSTALDYILGTSQTDKPWFRNGCLTEEELNEEPIFTNFLTLAEVIFEQIKDYSFMHGDETVVESVIEAVKINLGGIGDYLDSRMVKGNFLTVKQFGEVKEDNLWGTYGIVPMDCWARDKEMITAMFKPDTATTPMEVMYFDIPYIFTNTNEGKRFLEALKENADIEIFAHKSVQMLIDYQWNHRWNNLNRLVRVFPLILQLTAFWFWSNIFLPNSDKPHLSQWLLLCEIVLALISLYLLSIIVVEAIRVGPWNLVKNQTDLTVTFISIVLIVANIFQRNFVENHEQNVDFWRIQAWAALTIWFSFLIFMKSIDTFSYLIEMIQNVVIDMIPFLVIFLIAVVAFADSFQSIKELLIAQGEMDRDERRDSSFYGTYMFAYINALKASYEAAAMGNADEIVGNYGPWEWIIYFIGTIFNVIMLLNLLIAIISGTFERVTENAEATGYFEKVKQTVSIMHIVSRECESNPNKLLFLVQDLTKDMIIQEEKEDEVEGRLTRMQKDVNQLKTLISEIKDSVVKKSEDEE